MGSLLGKKKKKEEVKSAHHFNSKDEAILQLQRQRDNLRKYRKQIGNIIKREMEICRALIKKGLKDRARLVLRKKKYQESLIEKTNQQLLNVEEMIDSIEYATLQNKIYEALKVGKNALQEINNELSIEDVEQLMDDSAEAIEYQQQISEALGEKLTDEDDEAIMGELDELMSGEVMDDLNKLDNVPKDDIKQDDKDIEVPQEEEKDDDVVVEKKKVVKESNKKEVILA